MTDTGISDDVARVRRVIAALAERRGVDLAGYGDGDSLRAVGVDSLLTVQLVAGVQDEFGLEVPDSELRPERFDSVNQVVELVRGLR